MFLIRSLTSHQISKILILLAEREPIPIDDDCATYHGDADPQPGCSYWQPAPAGFSDEEEVPVPVVTQSPTADNTTAQVHILPPSSATTALPSAQVLTAVESTAVPLERTSEPAATAFVQDVPELDPDLMEILGEDPTSTKEYGREIQKDLAIRLNHIATSGLSKENRKELRDRYLVPVNCKFIKAPTLNPEIRVSLLETQAKRDKGIEGKQVLTSCALSSISEAITALLSSGHKNPELLKLLMDTARILGDIQFTDSISRRSFILSTVKKELKDQLDKTKIDEMLFGNSLADTLRSAKTIIKSGVDIRSSTMQSMANKPARAVNRPLNYRGPPARRRQFPPPPPGGARYARAAPSTQAQRQQTRTTHNNASRTLSRQPQPGHRR